MKTLLFVHGTGVRAKAFQATQRTIQKELSCRPLAFADFRLRGTYWGDECGVKLPPESKSIPSYDASTNKPTASEIELARWATLACDPYFELREVIRQDGPWRPRGAERWPPCREIPQTIGSLRPEGSLEALLDRHDLASAFSITVNELATSGSFQRLCAELPWKPNSSSQMFARMIAARTLARAEADFAIQLDGAIREQMVTLLIDPLGGRTGAVMEVFGEVIGTVWALLGPQIRWATRTGRQDLTNIASPAAGDVIAYQGPTGPTLRKRILADIEDAETEHVALLAHSLGGIACVDLLIEQGIPKVTHLITVGSQAPFLYETDSLCSLRYPQSLPKCFPRNWMNVFDRHDIFAYKAEGVFPESPHVFIEDFDVDSGVPFPQAHGAYWTNDGFWKNLEGFLKRP
jgi:hypothetical protein